MAYIDLNPIRAKISATPETSRFTSEFERIMAKRGAGSERDSVDAGETQEGGLVGVSNAEMRAERGSEGDGQECPFYRGEWLSPLELGDEVGEVSASVDLVEKESKAVPDHRTSKRASNKGCLPMSLAEYLQLLDWTGRQLRRDEPQKTRDGVPSYVAPLLQRLKITDDGWLALVKDFSRLFRRAAGTPAGDERQKGGQRERVKGGHLGA